MSDVLQVGGLEAKLTVDTTQFARSMQASGDRMQGLYTQVNAMPPALQKLEAQQQKVTRQMEEQRRKVLQMDAALDGAKSEYAALQQAVGRYSDEDMDAHFSKETAEIRKAEKQLAAYVNQMKALEQQRQQTVEKLNASAAKQTAADQYKSSSLAIDSMANSMRALTPILGDSIGSIGNLAERLVFMKQSMKAVELSGAATGAAISGGITLAVSAAAMLVEAWQKAEEEQRQAFEEAKQALAQYTEELREAEQAAKALDNQTSSVSDLTAARQDLADLFPNIVLGYDEEGKAILANNQALEQELELLKKKTKINREIMASGTYDSIKNYHKYSDPSGWDTFWMEWASRWEASFKVSPGTILTEGTPEYQNALSRRLSQTEGKALDAQSDAIKGSRAQLTLSIYGYDDLGKKAKTVANDMITESAKKLLSIEDENERLKDQQQAIENIRAVLGDGKQVEDRYKVIMEAQTEDGATSFAQISAVTELVSRRVEEMRKDIENAYQQEAEGIKSTYDGLYNARKASLDAEYNAVQDSLKAQQDAYRSMKFDVKSLDEQDLSNKIDLFNRRLNAEQDMYAKSAKAMQDRYYKEVQQIIQTANKEIQVYQDKLAALDEADRAAQEARTQRQNEAALRDLNESYAKQEAENAKEMAAAEKEYEEQRASLQAMIDKPTSRTARIIAERDLAALEERWRLEREGLEQDHAEKLLKIQRQLDEEKLTQQEDAEAAERDKEREHLNDLISDRQNSAQQLLTELNNRYTVEAEVQQKALAAQLENAKESYRKQLDAAKTYYDNLRDAALQKAKDRRDALVEQERLTSAALAEISGKQFDELKAQMERFGIDAETLGKSAGERWASGLAEGMSAELDWRKRVPSNLPDYYPPSLRIPGYASGGVVTRPTLAMVGEGGEAEAILPMSKLRQLIAGALSGSATGVQEMMSRAYYAMLPYRQMGTVTNSTQSTVYNIDTLVINDAAEAAAVRASTGIEWRNTP